LSPHPLLSPYSFVWPSRQEDGGGIHQSHEVFKIAQSLI